MSIISNAFEIERRGILWSPLITMNDGETPIGYDGNPNSASSTGTDGEQWLYGLPIGQFYKQSDATLWWKSSAPNVWTEMGSDGGTGSIETDTEYWVDGDTGDNNNDGSEASPFKNLDLLDKDSIHALPTEINATVTINVRGTVLSTGTAYHTRTNHFTGSGYINIVGETTDEQTGIAVTGQENTVTVMEYHSYLDASAEAWTVDEHRGRFIVITGGTGSGTTKYPIMGNTATRLETVDLPNTDGTSVIKIISVAVLKGATIADPSTLVDYSDTFGAFQISKNIIKIGVRQIDFSNVNNTDQKISFIENMKRIDLINCYIAQTVNINDNIDVSGIGCIYDCKNWSYISPTDSTVHLYNSIVSSSDNTGYGIYTTSPTSVKIHDTRISNQIYSVSSESGLLDLIIGNNVFFENNQHAILPLISKVNILTWGGYSRFKNNEICINLSGGRFEVDNKTNFISAGNTTEIKVSDTAGDEADFSDITSNNTIQNTATGGVISLYDSTTYLPIQNPEYNNTISGLNSHNFQGAIDELSSNTPEQLSITIHIATTGNDTTGDGSSGSPYYSVHKCIEQLKDIGYEVRVNIYVANGDYDFTALGDLKINGLQGTRSSIRIMAEDIDTAMVSLGTPISGTFSANTQFGHTDTGEFGTDNSLVHNYARIDSVNSGSAPSGTGKYMPVNQNTSDIIDVPAYGTNGDYNAYEIVEHGITLDFGANNIFISENNKAHIEMVGLKITTTGRIYTNYEGMWRTGNIPFEVTYHVCHINVERFANSNSVVYNSTVSTNSSIDFSTFSRCSIISSSSESTVRKLNNCDSVVGGSIFRSTSGTKAEQCFDTMPNTTDWMNTCKFVNYKFVVHSYNILNMVLYGTFDFEGVDYFVDINGENPSSVRAVYGTYYPFAVENEPDMGRMTIDGGTTESYYYDNLEKGIWCSDIAPESYTAGITNTNELAYDNTDSTLSATKIKTAIDELSSNTGQMNTVTVINETGETLDKGKIIYPDSESGGMPSIKLANSSIYSESRFIGMLSGEILDGETGTAVIFGRVSGIKTDHLSVGPAYLLADGELTSTRPIGENFNIVCCFVAVSHVTDGVVFMDRSISELTSEVNNTNGFPIDQRTGTTLDFNDTTRLFTIAPVGDHFHYYENGIKYIQDGSATLTVPETEGLHAIYFTNGVLTTSIITTESQVANIVRNNCTVSYIYWDNVNKMAVYFPDERHGISMSPETHIYLHETRGCQFIDGLGLGNIIVDGSGNLNTEAQFSISGGHVQDEDIRTTISGIMSNIGTPILYLEGNLLKRLDNNSGYSFLNIGTGRMAWNENVAGTYQLSEADSGNYVLCHVFGTNAYEENMKLVAVVGQSQYSNISSARTGASTEIASLLNVLITAESVPIATVIFQTRDNYNNDVKARIISTDTGESYIDWRSTELAQGVSASSHLNLSNLELAEDGVTWGHISDTTQTITGVKTFDEFPITPSSEPLNDFETANKKYVDDMAKISPEFRVSVAKSGADYTTVQGAIDSITVGAGEKYVIEIYPGIYTENVILKSGVNLIGITGGSGVTITSASGITLDLGSLFCHVEKMKVESSGILVTDRALIASGGMHILTNIKCSVDSTDSLASIVEITGGAVYLRGGCNIDGDYAGTSGGEVNGMILSNVTTVFSVDTNITIKSASNHASDSIKIIKDTRTGGLLTFGGGGSVGQYTTMGSAGRADLIEMSGSNAKFRMFSHAVTLLSIAGTGGSDIFKITGTDNLVDSRNNSINIIGFDAIHFSHNDDVDSTVDSRFDSISIGDYEKVSDAVTGVGTTNFVTSPHAGDIQLSGSVVANVIDISSDYGTTEDWQFDIMNMDTDTGNRTVTLNPTTLAGSSDGTSRTFFNVGSENLIIDTNGIPVEYSTVDRVIFPKGFITLEKIGSSIRIMHSYNTGFNINPADIPNEEFHIDFSDASSVTTTGVLIDAVTDHVGPHVGTPDIGKPTYMLAEQNGLNVAEWNSVNCPINFGNVELHNNTIGRGMTIFAVVKPLYSGDTIISKYFDGSPEREWYFDSSRLQCYENADASGNEGTVSTSPIYDVWQIIEVNWTAGGKVRAYVNGYIRAVGANTVVDIEDTDSDLRIGARDINGSDFQGQIGEIISYSGILTDDERVALTQNLGSKWDIQVNQPSAITDNYWQRDDLNNIISPDLSTDSLDMGDKVIKSSFVAIADEDIINKKYFDDNAGGGGEANTGSNIGTAGIGIFKQKTGLDLEFKNINAGSNKVTITDDTGTDEIDIDIDPANINMSDLNNDGNFVSDASYVHTDESYTSAEKTKLSNIADNAEVNVQSDWNAGSGGALILNKPTIPGDAPVDSVNGYLGVIVLSQDDIGDGTTYVRTHNDLTDILAGNIATNNAKITFDSTSSSKLSGIADSAEVNVQSDWNASSGDAQILNKPTIPASAPVDSVNTKTGVVVLNQDEILDGATYVRTHNDFTDTEQTKLSNISDGAEVNIQSDWNASSGDDHILNKPTTITVQQSTDIGLANTHMGLNDNPHVVTKTQVGLSNVPNIDTTNASNITTGTLSSSVLPPIALTKVEVYSDEATMLSATTESGDVAVRSDENKTYMKNTGSAGTMADWTELETPTDSVVSVNGETGTVVLTQDDVADGTTYVRTENNLTDTLAGNIATNNGKITFDSTSSTKLNGIAEGAEVNVQSDWNASSGDAQILNKPTIPGVAPVDSVNTKTGVVVLNQDEVLDGTTYVRTHNDFTDTEQTKLSNIADNAEVNVQSDWNASSGDAQILNKPTIPSAAPVDSVNTKTGVVVLNQDEILDGTTYVRTHNDFTDTEQNKLSNIEENAEVNNISDVNATDLTAGGDSTLHYHASDRNRTNHTGTQTASTISDFDTEVSNNTSVVANTAKETNATHTGEVTGDTVLTIADNIIDEANLKLDETPTNDYVLTADSTKSGGMKWSPVSGSIVEDTDVDIETVAIDSFTDTVSKAIRWDYVIDNGTGTNMRCGSIMAVWDETSNSTPSYSETCTSDIGNTSPVTFEVNKNINTVGLMVTSTSTDWSVRVRRYFI